MRIIYGKSKWELPDTPLEEFLKRVKGSGFAATEIYLKSLEEAPEQVARLHRSYGLQLVGQAISHGPALEDHLTSLQEQVELARRCQAAIINAHAGRDIFSFDENVQIFEMAVQLSQESGIPLFVETHRGRPTFSAIETRKYLQTVPGMQLTADFSHWMVVHESDLSDQPENVDLAVARSGYIHARVGYAEGPQVTDPRAPEWKHEVENHLRLWRRIAAQRRQAGAATLFVTPEFGPPQYMHTLPYSNEPVSDVWEVNVAMMDLLREALGQE
jgi:sugar phosphate isomerase/epimerase